MKVTPSEGPNLLSHISHFFRNPGKHQPGGSPSFANRSPLGAGDHRDFGLGVARHGISDARGVIQNAPCDLNHDMNGTGSITDAGPLDIGTDTRIRPALGRGVHVILEQIRNDLGFRNRVRIAVSR